MSYRVCEAGFESELRPEDVKDLPEATLKMHAKCFGRAHSSVVSKNQNSDFIRICH